MKILICALLAVAGLAESALAQSSSDVRFEGGRLTIHAANQPLSEILKAVAQLTNLEVIGEDGVTGSVSASIEAKPLREALDTLLAGFNFVLSTKPAAEANQPPRYVLLVVPREGPSRVPAAPPANSRVAVPALDAARLAEQQMADTYLDPDADPDALAEVEADAREREAELTEREAVGAFGSDVPFTDLLMDVEDGNPLVRHRVLAELHSRDPREAFPHVMAGLGDDDPGVGELAVQILGRMTDPESLKRVGELLTKSTDTAVRVRAFMVLAVRAEPSSTQYVKAVLDDENQIMREAAAQFLAEMEKRRRR